MEENKKKKKTNDSNNKKDYAKPFPKPKYIIPQNETLYVNHLNEKIKIDLLRENLYYLFSQFGDVLEINVRKSKKMRGQAFIVYKDVNEATRAKVSLNNFLFLGSRINVDYAKTKSDIIVKIKGQQSGQQQNNQEYQKSGTYISRKRKRLIEYGNIKDNDLEEDKKLESNNEEENEEEEEKSKKSKKSVKKEKNKENEKNNKNKDKDLVDEDKIEKNDHNIELNEEEDIDGECINENKILFVSGLGSEINEKMIEVVFNQFKGLKDIRFFNGRGFCFVEYDNEINAGTALLALNNMKLTETSTMKITYALKK